MKKVFLLIMMALWLTWCSMAHAETFTWDNDPAYVNGVTVNGTLYKLTAVLEAKLKSAPETGWKVISTVPDGGASKVYAIPNETFTRGSTLQFRIKSKIPGLDKTGALVTLESGYSNVVEMTIPSLAPENPRNLTVTLTLGNTQTVTMTITKRGTAGTWD